jgi:predicted phage tail protein
MCLGGLFAGWPTMPASGQTAAPNCGSASQTATIPSPTLGAPTGLSATPGNAQVTLSWSPPTQKPSALGYFIYARPSSSGTFGSPVYIPSSQGTSCTVTGLVDGTPYDFEVAAAFQSPVPSRLNQGPPSNEVAATPLGPPGAPTGLTAAEGNGQVSLSWTAPASNGGAPVTGYDVYDGITDDFAASTLATSSTITSAMVTGLTNGTPYYFWVTAVTSAGPSLASSPAQATPEAVAPGAPTGLMAIKGNSLVSLSWTAPASNGGAPVTGYRVYYGRTHDFTASKLAAISATTGATVSGLTNGTTYYFWVAAVTSAGPSPASGPAQATPEAVLPGAPTGLTATKGNAQVTLSWTAPASDGGAAVTRYHVYDGTTDDFAASKLAATSTTTGATVTGLTNGTTYYFWVTAVNITGRSPASNQAEARPASGSVPVQLIAVLAAVATVVVAGALTLAMRGRRLNSRSPRHVTPDSQVRAEPGRWPPDSVTVRETGSEPTHTIRFEPDRGTTITTIKEKS